MSATLEEVRTAAMQLTDDERAELAEMLWESIGDDDFDDSHRSLDGVTGEELHRELERRAKDAREHPELLLTWEQVRDRR